MRSWRRSVLAIATWRSWRREARKFIAKSGDRPFLVIVGYSDPHRAPENFGNTRVWPQVTRATYDPAKVIVPAHLPGLPEVRRDLADYYESISRLDSGVGLLLDALRETAHSDDTLVIYMSDNGRPSRARRPRCTTTAFTCHSSFRRRGKASAACATVGW